MTTNNTANGTTALQFDDLLTLEDQYYQEGLELGIADGQKAGRIEGRLFGIEKGFEKFAEMGEMNGRASFYLQQSHQLSSSSAAQVMTSSDLSLEADEKLKDLLERFETIQAATTNSRARAEFCSRDAAGHAGERLTKQIISLFDLTDPATLSSLNTEEATEDFDERRKRAKARLIMVEKALDAKSSSTSAGSNRKSIASSSPSHGSSALAASSSAAAVGVRLVRNEGMNIEKNIEDFGS